VLDVQGQLPAAAKLATAATSSATAGGQIAAWAAEVRLSTMARWISGMEIPTRLTTSVPASASIRLRG
jgi:hypothetical protein